MNPEEQQESPDLTAALLQEHARLGSGPDEQLVANILSRTVEAPQIPAQALERPPFGWQNWMKVAAIVMLFFGGITLALKQVAVGEKREEAAFELTVTILKTPLDRVPGWKGVPTASPNSASPAKAIAGEVRLVETTLPENADPTLPKLDTFDASTGERREVFVVSANETNRDQGRLEYLG
ncbi:MAG: hypothetical protein HKN23_20460, partial [Verrucomicrobiales bacterium]|nr:hypothetical protein [Verrucomicrobiales bacterium]